MNKRIGFVAWALGLVLLNVLLFTLNRGTTSTFWITFAFVWVALLSSLVFQTISWQKVDSKDARFLHMPAIAISCAYMVAQIPISIVFALGSASITPETAILVNALVLVLAWLLVLGGLAGKDHIQKINSRQKDHHIEL